MTRLVGTFEQAAPPFSAKKHKGVKYYEMARRGEEVPEASKSVTVYDFRPEDELRDGCLEFTLSCSSGTYVRSLAHDLGQSLGCGAHLAELRRLQVGPFKVDAAVTLAQLRASLGADASPSVGWIPLDEIPLPFGMQTVDHQQEQRLAHGQTVLVRDLEAEAGDWVKLVSRRGRLVAVGTIAERIGRAGVGVVQPRIVFE
jgi:tRNA pseudouridine55 synthase